MASFYDISTGQQVEFWRVLSTAGFTKSDVQRIIKSPSLATRMYDVVRPETKVVISQAAVGSLPCWWRSTSQQLERAGTLWPKVTLPEPPEKFVPRTQSEVLLLHVPDVFQSLWSKVVAPKGYVKDQMEYFRANSRNLRLAPGKTEFTEPVWLGFDPEYGVNQCQAELWKCDDGANLAASEVISALIQFPDWVNDWFHDGTSAPRLAGYKHRYYGEWLGVPYLRRWDSYGQVTLDIGWTSDSNLYYACPSVRKV